MDNSYFLQVGGLRLLIDPWLEGPEIDFFPWFNKQWHRTKPIDYSEVPDFDAVLITQKYPDHYHETTLSRLQPKTIFGPSSITKRLKELLPEANVVSMDRSNDQIEFEGIRIQFYPTSRKLDPIYDAFLLDDDTESVFLATHGFSPTKSQIESIRSASPCGLLVTPFNRYVLPFFLGGVVAPGLDGAQKLCELLSPRIVIATHDEDKHAEGIVSKFARVTVAPGSENLKELEWLKDRYMNINHYNEIQLA